jgi:hypothetical protein
MMDLSLGGPVEVEGDGDNPNKKHHGGCNDGVYGCTRCWDAENDGKGTTFTCEWCKTPDVPTLITRASDEPVFYAVCAACRRRQAQRLEEEAAEFDDRYYGDGPDEAE